MYSQKDLMMFKQLIAIVNQAQADGALQRYAMGGATAAIYYLEPVFTEDVDVFIHMDAGPSGLILGLGPIYDYFKRVHNAKVEGAYIYIADWPVQFLAPPNPLVEEALSQAIQVDIEDQPMWILRAEYLAAIALDLGRYKDKIRLNQFIELSEEKFNRELFMDLVNRFGLVSKWHKFQEQFLGG